MSGESHGKTLSKLDNFGLLPVWTNILIAFFNGSDPPPPCRIQKNPMITFKCLMAPYRRKYSAFHNVSIRNCPLVAILRTFFAAACAENKKAKSQDELDFIGGGSDNDDEL